MTHDLYDRPVVLGLWERHPRPPAGSRLLLPRHWAESGVLANTRSECPGCEQCLKRFSHFKSIQFFEEELINAQRELGVLRERKAGLKEAFRGESDIVQWERRDYLAEYDLEDLHSRTKYYCCHPTILSLEEVTQRITEDTDSPLPEGPWHIFCQICNYWVQAKSVTVNIPDN